MFLMKVMLLSYLIPVSDAQISDEVLTYSADELVAAYRRGDFTVEAYTEELIARRERFDYLNAYITQLPPADIIAQARRADGLIQQGLGGRLVGVPVAIKDNINSKDIPTTGGTPGLIGSLPLTNAPALGVLLQQDAILTGKLNLDELAKGFTTENAFFGPTGNPYNDSLVAGGSSGGTGAMLATSIAVVGLGTDTTGSGRVPASFCGVVGFRPTWGRYSLEGVVPLQFTRDAVAPMANNVRDVQLLDDLLCQTQSPSKCDHTIPIPENLTDVRFGISRKYFYEGLDPETELVIEKTLDLLASAGATFVDVEFPDLPRTATFTTPMINYDAPREIGFYLAQSGLDTTYLDIIQNAGEERISNDLGSYLTDPVGIEAFMRLYNVEQPAYRNIVENLMSDNNVDALIHPTTRQPANAIGETPGTDIGHNTEVASFAALPELSVPGVELTDCSQLPVGLAFLGRSNHDEQLLAIGALYDEIRPRLPRPFLQ